MAPNNFLHGLNIVHSPVNSENNSRELLSGPTQTYPELDLWTTLAFQSDEPLIEDRQRDGQKDRNRQQMQQHQQQQQEQRAPEQQQKLNPSQAAATFDLAAFLSGFGVQAGDIPQNGMSASSLAQVLAMHPQPQPPTTSAPLKSKPSLSLQTDTSAPPAKRSRIRSASIISNVADAESAAGDDTPGTSEDKRRRNTAASARFRMKKKEREIALEKHAKELEGRVNELEKECEGLRRENGWLKGLVVGVTGANNAGNAKKRQRDESGEFKET